MSEREAASNIRLMTVAALSGVLVRDRESQDLGCIEELMVDPVGGTIAYAVLSFGTFLGVSGKLWPVPWKALRFDPKQRVFILEADRALLETAPMFQDDQWPDFTDQAWGVRLARHYGLPASEEANEKPDKLAAQTAG